VAALRADARFAPGESRPHMRIPAALRPFSLTAGPALRNPDRVPVPPLVFVREDGREAVCVAYVGRGVCGHPGVVHGGLVATLFDEALAGACFRALPGGTGMTARLEVDYRKPVRAGQFLVVRCEVESIEGRKAWVKGRLETVTEGGEEGVLLAEGKALYVAPKNLAGLMKIPR
jgi:uncharacterized protein (TIGR00369 family)